MRVRVSLGWMTASTKPRCAATSGLANLCSYSSVSSATRLPRKMISTAPLAPITATSADGHA
eukprot:scaffold20356_cov125-Isochrysis_galbana.AAC.13